MKRKTIFVCGECGTTSPKWLGRCPGCGSWNTMSEERAEEETPVNNAVSKLATAETKATPLREIPLDGMARMSVGIGELDRVLGGGMVPGGVVLIGGDPGIGKSTLMLQAAQKVAGDGRTVLYVTGEESASQTRLRAERLGDCASQLFVMAETRLDAIMDAVPPVKPTMLVVDSIQTLYSDTMESAPGSVGQVREVAGTFMRLAKMTGLTVFLVGHVTKSGAIAGPKVIEHLVDTVLYFEGEGSHSYRILRAVKNRFGSTNEIGVFEMRGNGLSEVLNPSELFLSERASASAGTVVTPCLEGSRPILIEVQALVSPTSYGMPQRMSQGFDRNRLALLIAVMERKGGLALGASDVFINIAGGMRVTEPAADLAIAAAMASSQRDKAIDPATMYFGEIGLAGEIRAVSGPDARLAEGAKLGFTRCVMPEGNAKRLKAPKGLKIVPAKNLEQALDL